MNEKLTHEEFKRLLDAYLGAREHEEWTRKRGTQGEWLAAVAASKEARKALTVGVFGDER